jgi:hypothetical protein
MEGGLSSMKGRAVSRAFGRFDAGLRWLVW